MLDQAFAVSGSVTVALVGLVASNLLYDRGVANSLSRYVAPILGGVAFLVAVLWLDAWGRPGNGGGPVRSSRP